MMGVSKSAVTDVLVLYYASRHEDVWGGGGGRAGHIPEHVTGYVSGMRAVTTTGHKYIYVGFIAGSC